MLSVNCFSAGRGNDDYFLGKLDSIIKSLKAKNIPVYKNVFPCDVSIAIYGLYENPIALYGKRVLAYDKPLWFNILGQDFGWRLCKPLLDEYYHEFLDITGLSSDEQANKIEEYISSCV